MSKHLSKFLESTWIWITGILIAVSLILVFFWVPDVEGLGWDFKIFFFHVPAAWLMLLSALVSGTGGAFFLAKGKGAEISRAGATAAFVFGLIVLTTGPLWAWRAWGTFWVWEPRLTTSLVCWLTFACSTAVSARGGSHFRTLSIAINILGAINVPIVYLSVRFTQWGHHPGIGVVPGLESEFALTLIVCLTAMTSFWGLLLRENLRLYNLEERISEITARIRVLGASRKNRSGMAVLAIAFMSAAGFGGAHADPSHERSVSTHAPSDLDGEPGDTSKDLLHTFPAGPGDPGDVFVSAGTLAAVLSAYLLLWGILLIYLMRLHQKTGRLRQKTIELEEALVILQKPEHKTSVDNSKKHLKHHREENPGSNPNRNTEHDPQNKIPG